MTPFLIGYFGGLLITTLIYFDVIRMSTVLKFIGLTLLVLYFTGCGKVQTPDQEIDRLVVQLNTMIGQSKDEVERQLGPPNQEDEFIMHYQLSDADVQILLNVQGLVKSYLLQRIK